MRTLIIIQSLIIVAGAYYIYTLAHTRDGELEKNSDKSGMVVEIDTITEVSDEENQSEATIITESETDIMDLPLGNDIGMEFPIPDNEADLQAR